MSTSRRGLVSHAATAAGTGTADGSGSGGTAGKGSGSKKSSWIFDSQGWKRFSVLASIALSIASLILSSIAELDQLTATTLRALTVTGIIVNAISVALSAATSLDWRTEAAQDKAFLDKLLGLKLVDVHDDGRVSLRNPSG